MTKKAGMHRDSMTITWLREQYLKRTVTVEQVINGLIARSADDAAMNIWIVPPTLAHIEPYLAELGEMDFDKKPLWGIPFAVKDNIDIAGLPTSAGCPEYQYTPSRHAVVVERLIHAGAIPVGKTNLDQFATGLVGTRSPYGETHNAWNSELISGGSSSGSAVAVARGHVAFALGTDTAGSGRVPAALNKVVGLKPSIGAWPTTGVVPACASLDCVTVFANELDDVWLVDRFARGTHEADPWSRLLRTPRGKRPQRIVLPKEEQLVFFGPYAEQYKLAWQATVDQLVAMDIPVQFADYAIFEQAARLLYDGPWVAERWAVLGDFVKQHAQQVHPVTAQVLRSAEERSYDAASVFTGMHQLQEYRLAVRKQLADAVLIMPTTGGTWTREQVNHDPIQTNNELGRYTNHCNLLDLCALAIPSQDAASGLPFGITLFALAENEGLVRKAAELIMRQEKRQPEKTMVAVCGLHMRGYPLEKQMLQSGARFLRATRTAKKYQFIKLSTTPAKPGLVKKSVGGCAIEVELWEMPIASFGSFASSIPSPLGIGKIELADGSEVPGFICEGYAADEAMDISAYGSWRRVSFT